MANLLEALSALGVPDAFEPSELEAFGDNILASVDAKDLDSAEEARTAAAGSAPEFIALAEAAARAEMSSAGMLLDVAAEAFPTLTNLVFRDSADVALCCPNLLQENGRTLAIGLYDRVADTRRDSGLQAYSYLEALTRLGLTEKTARFRALEHLSSVNFEDSESLLERLPRLIGVAIDVWGEPELAEKLYLLLEHDVSRADAAYELAQLTLRDALESRTVNEALSGLVSARDKFTTVESMEEAREDATLYKYALDVAISFAANDASCDATAEAVAALSVAMARRVAWKSRSDLGRWAAPRYQAEVEWFTLARTLESAIDPLAQPSWNTPEETLARVLAAYRSSRSITVMAAVGLRVVIEPVVEAAFLRREGLLNHLRGLVESESLHESELHAARDLLDVVSASEASAGGDARGKAWGLAPDLVAELADTLDRAVADELVSVSSTAPNLLRTLNHGAKTRARVRAREADPIVDELLEGVMRDLNSCPGLVGIARDEFSELLTSLLKFAADRANIGRMNGGPDVDYLFRREGGGAYTEDFLQRDVAKWLRASNLRRFVEAEQHDVASGRADITVTQNYKFTIEIKRDVSDVSREALLRKYGGQAAAYSVTGPSVSLEMVLDLTDHSSGMPALRESVWVQRVPISGGQDRDVVTVVIRGNRLTPRNTRSS